MKKIVKILLVILIVIILLLIGRRIYYMNVEIKPEDVYLTKENSEESIKMNLGSYSWEDKGINAMADSIPAEDMGNLKVLNVKSGEKVFFSNYDWTSSVARILLIQDNNVAGLSVQTNVEESYILVPSLDGEYIIQIDLKSEKGDVWYAARLNISK